jgi:hypothetical protein
MLTILSALKKNCFFNTGYTDRTGNRAFSPAVPKEPPHFAYANGGPYYPNQIRAADARTGECSILHLMGRTRQNSGTFRPDRIFYQVTLIIHRPVILVKGRGKAWEKK